jgi:ribonuclease BN (tRNA processing enzyme)
MISTNRPLFALTLRFALGIACCATALPQPAITQQSASKTTLITLGTQGGPFQSRNRAQPANVLIVNEQAYVVEAGNAAVRQLSIAGIPLARVSHIFITHNHDDHNADAGTMMGLAWSLGRSAPFTVHALRAQGKRLTASSSISASTETFGARS